MIVTSSPDGIDVQTSPHYDIGRPDLFSELDHKIWSDIHKYIKECDYPIVVNGAFHFIDKLLEEGTGYGGGGMKYFFWFATEEDKQIFVEKIDDFSREYCNLRTLQKTLEQKGE